jgi:FkbM family methyltransferase
MLNPVKKMVTHCLGYFGLELQRKKDMERATMYMCLVEAAKNGLQPATVIDVGAAYGTLPLYKLFPEAHFIFLEPLDEFAPTLREIVRGLKHAEYLVAAATSKPGEMVINVHPDLVGSSLYKEEEGAHVDGVERRVPGVSLNEICATRETRPPYLIKIDTQGSELDVLRGAEQILPQTDFIIMEVSLFGFFKGGPQLYDCMEFMKARGFVAYDIFDPQYRLLDGAMSQIDIAFVQDRSKFRKFHFYATREQRAEQNRRFGVK